MGKTEANVLHICRSQNFSGFANTFGGLDRAVASVSSSLRTMGIKSDILFLDQKAYCSDPSEKLIKYYSDQIHSENYNCIHFHDWYGEPLAKMIFRHGFRNIILTTHLPVRRGFTYRDVNRSFEDKIQMESMLLDLAKVIIAPSNMVAKLLSEEYGIASSKIKIVGHGVDLKIFFPGKQGNSSGTTLLYVGRLERQKGLELLLYATQGVFEVMPEARLKIVGEGSLEEELREMSEYLGISENVSFVGPMYDDELREIYARSNLLVAPSLFEPFGLVGLEALACKCQVLSVQPTGADYLDGEQLTHSISPSRLGSDILRSIKRQKQMEERNYKKFVKEWTWENSAKKLKTEYLKIVND